KRSSVPVELLVARQAAAAVPRTALGFGLIFLVALPAGRPFGPAWVLPVVAHPPDIRQPDPLSRDDPRTGCAQPARVEPLHAPAASLPDPAGRWRTRHGP